MESQSSDFYVNRLVCLFRFGVEWEWVTSFYSINGLIGDAIDPDNNRTQDGLDRPSELKGGTGKRFSMNIRKASIGVGG